MNISNETPMVAGVGSNDSNNAASGLATGLLTGMALARREEPRDHLGEITCKNSSDMRDEIQEVKSALRETLFNFQSNQAMEFRNLGNRMCESEKEEIKNTLENRIKLLEVENRLQKDISESRIATERQFNTLSGQIDECCCSIKQNILQSKLDATQDELNELRIESSASATTSTIINALIAAGIVLPAGVVSAKK